MFTWHNFNHWGEQGQPVAQMFVLAFLFRSAFYLVANFSPALPPPESQVSVFPSWSQSLRTPESFLFIHILSDERGEGECLKSLKESKVKSSVWCLPSIMPLTSLICRTETCWLWLAKDTGVIVSPWLDPVSPGSCFITTPCKAWPDSPAIWIGVPIT